VNRDVFEVLKNGLLDLHWNNCRSQQDEKTLRKKAPLRHTGKGRVLLHETTRGDVRRFGVVRLMTPAGRCTYAAVIGHTKEEDVIQMDLDMRESLGLRPDEFAELEIRKANALGTLWWYLTVQDPLIRVPAVLAALSVFLGLLSVILAFVK
jgi:hypothetical protein